MMGMRGAEYPSVLRFISELHNSFREALCRNEPQLGVFALPEELLPLPHNEWMDRELEPGPITFYLYDYMTPTWSQTHRTLKTIMGS